MRGGDHVLELWSGQADALLDKLVGEYRGDGLPIQVDVRQQVHWVSQGERLTHGIHAYPARLLRHIPTLFVSSSRYSKRGDLVADPFCGSGTVLLEAVAFGRRAIGADANPLARLISKVKVTPLAEDLLLQAVDQTIRRQPKRQPPPPWIVNRPYWFTAAVTGQLAKLRAAIDGEANASVRDFLQVCLSASARRASLADPRISVPVRLKRNQYPVGHWLHEKTNRRIDATASHDCVADFRSTSLENARRVGALAASGLRLGDGAVTSEDARALKGESGARLRSGGVRLIITSPPYLGAQKYIRSSSLSLGWLGLTEEGTLRKLEDATIGREHFRKGSIAAVETGVPGADALIQAVRSENPLRAHIASTYLCEMRDALREMHRVLAAGGALVMVTGSNRLCGRQFHTTRYLTEMALELGFDVELELVDAIRSRGLMTRRNSSAAVIETESVTVLLKR
jgi:hypothetical protein